MSTFVYWNRKDNDCDRMFHFMSQSEEHHLLDAMGELGGLSIEEPHRYFSDISNVLESIRSSDLSIFLTHGEDDRILKFKVPSGRTIEEFTLINRENADCFKEKKVIAFCCSTAKKLGRYCIERDVGCKVFIGFDSDIVYDNGEATSSRALVYTGYKNAFRDALYYAIENKSTCKEFQQRLVFGLRRAAVDVPMNSKNHSINSMFLGASNSLVVLGDSSLVLME